VVVALGLDMIVMVASDPLNVETLSPVLQLHFMPLQQKVFGSVQLITTDP
jgi:hypothetical protein